MTEFEYIGGIHGVEHALRRNGACELFFDPEKSNPRVQTLIARAERAGVKVTPVASAILDKWVNGIRHQGVVARLKVQEPADLTAILADRQQNIFLLVLDGIQDPHNLGACLRTADAAGVDAVIVPKDRAVAMTPTVRKVASGAAESIPLIRVTNLARTLRELKDAGLWIVGTSDPAAEQMSRHGALKPDLSAALAKRPPGSLPVIVSHQPRIFYEARERKLPLTLSAHTHGGQCGIRSLGWSLAGVFLEYHMGLYRWGASQLYINTGTGYWLVPFRLGMTPEITLIELRRKVR